MGLLYASDRGGGPYLAQCHSMSTIPSDNNASFFNSVITTPLCIVDRLNYWVADTLNNATFQYIYIHNFPKNEPGGFYFLRFCRYSGRITVHNCASHPIGALWVCDTVTLCIYPMYSDCQYCQMKQEASRVFHNYKQDCFIRHQYGTSYEDYLTNIIDTLIVAQDSVDGQTDTDTSVQCSRIDTNNDQGHSVSDNNKPSHLNLEHGKLVQSDINYPDKVRGYIAL